ncbi:hypothetical protein DYB35_000941 [Aphanomyces astaci]|uniref:Arrestin C-terminal-like domain-containing protein n=1 Tax=Aphanomyces astaci TaxID=112090 RepID=A0A418DDP1_APHAT|nr:hypothetical protein DYB35_000941 [Aphanomyces astaci]
MMGRTQIVLYCVERILQPGTYEFPFDYQLPDNLPGSFDAKKESSGVVAKIEYSMTGTVIVDGVFARDLMKKAVLVLYTSHAGQLVQPSVDTCSRKVSYLCFDQGTCAFKASADKTVYNTTDTPQIHIDIQNGSKQNVLRIQCRLVRQDVLTAADGAIKTVRTELCDASFPGVPAHAVISQDLPFALTTKLLAPSTKGSLLVVTYVIHVLCDLPRTASDILLALPIEITSPVLRQAVPSTTQPSTASAMPPSPKHTITVPTDGTTAQPPIVIATTDRSTLNDRSMSTAPSHDEATTTTPRTKRATMAIVQSAPRLEPPFNPPLAVATPPATTYGQMQPMQIITPYPQPIQQMQFGTMSTYGGMTTSPPSTMMMMPPMMAMPGQNRHMVMQHPSNMVTLPGNMGGFMMQPQVSPGMHMMSNPRPPPTNNLDTVSVDGGGPADVLFVNLTPMPIDLLWVDTVGVESFYARLHPTESYLQPTFTNHMWKVGQCGQILLAYRVRVGGQRVEVLGPGLANYF